MADADRLRVRLATTPGGTRVIDCGIHAAGGLEAGRRLAEICLADCGNVAIESSTGEIVGPVVAVRTDQPVVACLGAQYAGWQVTGEKYFAMGSGPMRYAEGIGSSLEGQVALRVDLWLARGREQICSVRQ